MNRTAARAVCAALVLSAIGCGDGRKSERPEPDAGTDAGGEDGGDFVPPEPEPPQEPAPPEMTPCPAGWREVVDPEFPDVTTCDPWPPGGPADCADDEAHFPGSGGCERIGTPCPDGDFPEGLPGGATVRYVRAGDPAGGDGSLARPFGTIAEALIGAPDGTILALSKGRFDVDVTLEGPITLWGACVAETVLASPNTHEAQGTVRVQGRGGAVVRNLEISGERVGILVTSADSPVQIESVLVRSTLSSGVRAVSGSEIVARDLVVRDVRPGPAGSGGEGIYALGSRVELHHAVVETCRHAGILTVGDAELVGEDLAIRDTRPDDFSSLGGFGVEVGGRITLERATIENSHQSGVRVDDGSVFVATDLVVRGTRAASDRDETGFGVWALAGAEVSLDRVTLDENGTSGIQVQHRATLVARDLVVRRTLLSEVESRREAGLTAIDATVSLSRAVFEGNSARGIAMAGLGSSLTAEDVVVRDMRSASLDAGGFGLVARDRTVVRLDRVSFERTRAAALLVGDPGSSLVGADVSVRETLSQERDRDFGYGLQVTARARVELTRTVFSESHRAGILVVGSGTTAAFEDLLVEDTLERECVTDGCAGEGGGGSGLAALDGAVVEVTRLRISDNALCGVQLARDGTIDLHEGEVSRNTIGANVRTEGFDVARIRDRVVYLDNARTLDSTALPVPEAVTDVDP